MSKIKICIFDLGWGNLSSVATFCLSMGYNYEIINRDNLRSNRFYDVYIICGVGSASSFNLNLDQLDVLRKHIRQAKVVIGFCLGAHFLCQSTDEYNSATCLNIVPVEVVSLPKNITNIGYRDINYDSKIYRIYHCHSFGISDFNFQKKSYIDIIGNQFIGMGVFENIVLIQGHPEKSGNEGQKLFRNIIHVST